LPLNCLECISSSSSLITLRFMCQILRLFGNGINDSGGWATGPVESWHRPSEGQTLPRQSLAVVRRSASSSSLERKL
jgi:hypothetical protein